MNKEILQFILHPYRQHTSPFTQHKDGNVCLIIDLVILKVAFQFLVVDKMSQVLNRSNAASLQLALLQGCLIEH